MNILNFLEKILKIDIGFCIANIIIWGLSGVFLFIVFLVKFVELRTNPDLAKKVELYERRFGKLVAEEKKILEENII